MLSVDTTKLLIKVGVFSIYLCVVVVLALLSLLSGAGYISAQDAFEYLMGLSNNENPTQMELVIWQLRFPRLIVGLIVGAALGAAGALLQTITRNPLAEPGLLGVNAGAALGVVLGISFFSAETGLAYLFFAFSGALAGTLLVLSVAQSSRQITPIKLILSGVAIQATFQGFTAFILMKNQVSLDQYRFWVLGSLSGSSLELASEILPALLLALVIIIIMIKPLSALMLDDELVRSLGYRPGLIRTITAIAITLCTGASVALTGPIAFLGLMAPHIAKKFMIRLFGNLSHLSFITGSALTGAVLLLAADILARLVTQPYETPVSVVIACIGAPMLIWIVRIKPVVDNPT